MTTVIQARQDIVTAVEAARAAYSGPLGIEYENRDLVNPANQHQPWLAVTISVLDAFQGDLAEHPIHRHIGVVLLEAHVKEGTGTVAALSLLNHFSARLQRSHLGMVRTHLADARPSGTKAGWYVARAAVPFWFDLVV